MPVRDIATRETIFDALESQDIFSNTTTEGAIIDTANFDCGFYFALLVSAWTDGLFTLKLEHGDDSGLSDAADVPATMLINALAALGAAIVEGAAFPKTGVHSTKRYLRASIVTTGVTSGGTAQVVAVGAGETLKTSAT